MLFARSIASVWSLAACIRMATDGIDDDDAVHDRGDDTNIKYPKVKASSQ